MSPNNPHGTTALVRRPRVAPGGAKALRRLAESNRLVGWREWLALPQLGISRIRAKVDTGARTSALHVYDLEFSETHGDKVVRFTPPIDDRPGTRPVEVMVRDIREVRSSSGQAESRYVISTDLVLGALSFVSELTLTSRDDMTYNMLIGRSALRIGRLIVHPGRSFVQGLPQTPSRR